MSAGMRRADFIFFCNKFSEKSDQDKSRRHR